MKKVILGILLLTAINSQGQNVQLMYDFGSQKEHLTATFEHFNVDKSSTKIFKVKKTERLPGFSISYLNRNYSENSPIPIYLSIRSSINLSIFFLDKAA